MDKPSIEVVVERLERLERQCRRWRWIGIALALVLASALTVDVIRRSRTQGEIRTGSLLIIDPRGRPSIRLGSGGGGMANGHIQFFDDAGKTRMVMGIASARAAVISLIGRDGRDQLVLDADDDRGLGITFRNIKDDSGLMLTTGEGIAAIGFMSPGGNVPFNMGLNPNGKAELTIRDNDGEELLHLPK